MVFPYITMRSKNLEARQGRNSYSEQEQNYIVAPTEQNLLKLNIWSVIEENPTEISGEPPLIQWLFNPNNATGAQVCCQSFYSSKLRPQSRTTEDCPN